MPITNGNYVAPAWQDYNPPPINDAELIAISDTVAGNQIIRGTGAPTSATVGKIGQRYADGSTSPNTIYQCISISGGTYTWQQDADPNRNVAQPYSTGGNYAAGDFCIYDGGLYEALEAVHGGAWNAEKWGRRLLADCLSQHVADENNPHRDTPQKSGAADRNDLAGEQTTATADRDYENGEYFFFQGVLRTTTEDIAEGDSIIPGTNAETATLGEDTEKLYPVMGTVTISAVWSGEDPYYQAVSFTGGTAAADSKIDLFPSAAQMEQLAADGIAALMIENDNGNLTAHAVGGPTSVSMTVVCAARKTF